jgi:hypothetical protein
MLLSGVKRNFVNLTGRNNNSCDRLKRFESTAAVDILALVITLFGFFGNISAAFGVRSRLA